MSEKRETVAVGWAYNLRKDEVIRELRERNIEVDESSRLDDLRRLIAIVLRGDKGEPAGDVTDIGETAGSEESENEHEMSADTPKLEFCLEKDDWETFVDRLEIFFMAKSVKNELKAATMLTKFDEDAFKLVRNLRAPNKPLEKTFEELKKIMGDNISPPPSEVMERYNFNQAKQNQTESVAEFAARLKKLALHCGFQNLQTALRDQFVCGISNYDTKVELFKKTDLTFDDAFKEAAARESAMKNALSSGVFLEKKTLQREVLHLKANSPSHAYEKKSSLKKKNTFANNPRTSRNERPQQVPHNEERASDIVCFCCGQPNNRASQCRQRFKYCPNCNRRGHLEVTCRQKGSTTNSPRPSTVNFLEETTDHTESTSTSNNASEYYKNNDFYALELYTTDNRVLHYRSRRTNIVVEPMFIETTINGIGLRMEIDTGTYVSVLSEQTKNRLFGNLDNTKSEDFLRGYDKKNLFPIGVLQDLTVSISNKTANLACFVMPGTGPTLIGRQWLATFGMWPLKLNNFDAKIQKLNLTNIRKQLVRDFSLLFGQTPGLFNRGKLKIYLKENVRPIALKARHVPYAMKKLIEDEINRLVEQGHLEAVDVSEWATPIVPVIKNLKAGRYVPVKIPSDCNSLCSSKNESEESKQCCDDLAICACGTATGHYACICPRGYFGSGLKGFCQPCPNGTFDPGDTPNDFGASCIACPHVNHVTTKIPATSADDCVCAPGFTTDGENCEAIRCPKLKVPENGYFVKASACSNVVNAACGLRCRIGFNLIGDSIRLCRNDGIWSGIEPQCLLKTCAALRAPAHGRIRCEHDENEPTIKTTDLTDHPIDTRCQFKCDIGFQLRGSKVRNCLPLSRWDGLKVACKQIKCEPLRRLANGNITPEICTGSKKLPYATNCTFSCDAGFVLIGPKIRHCTGKNGIWSQRHSVNQCVDKTPPIITCPTNSTWETLPGKNHALVNWTIPIASDTSDKIPKVWSKPHISLPWKARVGSHRIVYVAQDSSGNRARCKFVIRVIDTEPPAVEDCVDPPIFLTARQTGEENVTWNEPIFHDNSGRPVKIDKSHQTPQCINCPLGKTQIFYNATDVFHNSASCIINVTIKDACKDIPILSNGQANCQMIGDKAVKCAMTCDEGYGFTFGQPDPLDETIILTCGFNESAWNITYSPDCSVMEIPNSVGRDVSVILQGNTSVCDNATLIRQLTDQITGDLASKMLEICGNNIDCSLVKYDSNCEDEFANENEIDSNVLGRQKRSLKNHKSRVKRKRGKIEIKLRFVGKIIAENRNNPKLGIRKLREKIEAMTKSGELDLLNNRTNQEIAKLALNLKTVFKEPQEICEIGRVLKKHNCTKCPEGTFHNTTREQCQACNFGEYQNSTATAKCIKCPEHKFTRKMHSKKLSDCLNVCQPGAFSRRKPNQVSSVGLEPCTNCDIGFYQPNYGQTFCHACPNNRTTHGRGSASLNDCFAVVKIEDPCMKNPCLNGGHCTSENGSFSCECQECYIGSRCESRQDLCESSPCLNEGECNSSNKNGCPYSCNCKPEFTGQNCETYIDECTINPCQNGGSCTSTDKDFNCVCEDGFEGDFCETKVNHCEPWTCEEGSICTIVDGTWKCLCKAGFLGLRCNLLPCDWIPCHSNAICLNIEEMNATRKSYRCVCPDGYEGADCSVRIDHCKRVDCLNDGKCVNRLLNYTCECPMTFDGVNCETELSSDFVLNFSEVGTSDYVIMKGPKKNLTEITICVWLQSVDTFNYGTVLSYATKYQDNSLTLTDYNGFVLYVNGEKVVTDITVNDGFWHFLCVDWKSYDGSWNAYVDGVLKDNGTHLGKKSIIAANGTIVIGQEQDRLGGGFSASEAFLGKLSYLDVWDKVLGNEAVTRMMKTCESYFGSIVAWAQIRKNLRGNVLILDGIFCRGCPTPIVTLKAIINVSEDGSEIEYSCEAGYSVRVGNWIGSTYKRRCLKHGEWEGYHVPICTKVKCGYPGYFPRGRVYGTSFVYGDEIYYSCNEGYEIRGNPHRFCNADGNWSGIQPICIGVTCKNLLAPENGDIEYIMEEHERDDISIIQVGQQLEFKCETGFRLSGERYLTCLETGKWDYDRPVCVPAGCRSPNLTQHVQVSANQSTILPIYDKFNRASLMSIFDESPDKIESSIYSFGDVVGLFCHDGYKFQGNTNLLIEFRLQCSTNGSWTGLVPDCVKLQCVSPANVENGKIFMIFENGTKMEISSKVNYSEGTRISKIHSNENSDESDRSEIDLFEKLTSEDDNIEISDDKNIELIPGTNILIVCDRGYEIKGEATRVCLESEIWSSDEPKCVPKNCSVEDHPVLGLLAPKINNSMSNFVNNLQEYKEKFTNVRGTFGNVSVIFEGNYYKEQVIFACENDTNFNVEVSGGKKYIQNLTWRCDDEGEWQFQGKELNESNFAKLLIGEVQICKGMTCDRPQIPSNGYIVNASNTTEEIIIRRVNETIILRCRNGYNIEGDDKVACLQNGTWSVMPTCRRVSCKNPPKILNAFLEGKSAEIHEYVFGNMITYKCIQGYRIFGQANARCLANGQWSKIHGKCSKISCGKPKIASGVMIYGRSYLYREQLTYKCPNGITKGTITCNSDGKWSVLPVCNSVQ